MLVQTFESAIGLDKVLVAMFTDSVEQRNGLVPRRIGLGMIGEEKLLLDVADPVAVFILGRQRTTCQPC